jgi:hypothetical protein
MTTITLLTKAGSPHKTREINEFFQATFADLDVEAKISGNAGSWMQVSVSGEDEEVAKNFIAKEIGLAPASLESISVGAELKGLIKKNPNPGFLAVDIGIIKPKIFQANISLSHLRQVLMDDKKIELPKIMELWALKDDLPLNIKVVSINEEDGTIEAELSVGQIDKLRLWRDSYLDRLVVLGSPKGKVEEVLQRARLDQDVIDIESLGLFELVLTCKLGTDAAGIIPRIGGYLKYAEFYVFNPRKIIDFVS